MNGENQLADLKLWVLFVEKWYPETICAAFKRCVGWKLSWVTIIQATAQNYMYTFAGDTPFKTYKSCVASNGTPSNDAV